MHGQLDEVRETIWAQNTVERWTGTSIWMVDVNGNTLYDDVLFE